MSSNSQTMGLREIDELRNNIIANLRAIELSKHVIRSHDRVKLVNHHNFILETLDNMINIKRVEMSDPYNSWAADPTDTARLNATTKTIVYNRDGSTRIVECSQLRNRGEEWETQFDETQLLNPPCYMMPPQNLYSIPKISHAGKR